MAYPSPQWKQWVETLNQIGNAITALHGKRAIWRSYQEHGKAGMASDEDGPFHDWIIRNYADSVTIGIRRVIDDDRRVRSLVRLLRDIEKRSGEITMAAFQSLWADAPHLAVVAPSCFERITGTRSVLPSSVPRNDRVQLKLRLRQLENWTNTRIAHTASGNPNGDDLTYREVDEALDLLEEVYQKYHLLLTAVDLLKCEPTYAQFYEDAILRLFGKGCRTPRGR